MSISGLIRQEQVRENTHRCAERKTKTKNFLRHGYTAGRNWFPRTQNCPRPFSGCGVTNSCRNAVLQSFMPR